jgi:serine/threonine-protein kinase HipA
MVSNEALCMRIAYHLGISAAKVEVGEFDGMQVLIVERYDRSRTDQGKVVRLHQEDFCQAQGVRSEQKYEDRGGPSLSRCAKLLDQWSQDKDRLERLLDINTLNVIVGNGDAHAKNLSLLYSGGRQMWASLAPAYDVVSTVWYKTITTKSGDKRAVSTVPGMHVNGVRDINAVTKDDLVQEAVIWGVPQDKADARVSQLLLSAEDAVQRAAGEIEPPGDLVDMLHTRVRKISS